MLIVVVLCAGLGAAYRAIPEPAPCPTSTLPPTPVPPALPAPLSEAIDREVRALADGDAETMLAAHVLEDQAWTDSEAIEKGLDIPFAEFDLKWQIWTKKTLTPLT